MKTLASPEKTEFGPGKTPLYYNNVGLFSDPFIEERLPNIEEYYSDSSAQVLGEYWNVDDHDAETYNWAFQRIMDIWHELDKDVPKFCTNESQLQNRWINKILEILGWTIEVEESSSKNGITNFPDYALYASNSDWKKSKGLKSNNKFKRAISVADAKAWGVNLDGKGFSNKNPSYQIINYLRQTNKQWGILTDGKYWRIYSLRTNSKHAAYYEIDIERILRSGDYERFKYFYNFFRVDAFINDSRLNDRSFLDFVFEDGQFYSQRVESNLNERVYKVVESICQGFLKNYNSPTEDDLNEIYDCSMYYLFKLMFVLNCESKGLLEVNKQDDYYEFSLRKKCKDLKEQLESGKKWSQQPRTYNYILDLFDLLKNGDESIGVHQFGNEPFDIGGTGFYHKNKIADDILNKALIDLSCESDEDGNLQFIDYKILSPDHIGSLFEGLLEYNLKRQKGGKYSLVNTKGDRKSTGSYYTPDYLVDYIVEETLSGLTEDREPKDILELKVLDPSMGSGHFLLGVVKYLERIIIEQQDTDKKVNGAIDFDKIRKEVLKSCVFGVDINPLATQLAKFSLWIYTSQKGDKLEPLSDQLITDNSLTNERNWSDSFHDQLHEGEVDAIVGNPPYIGEKGNKEKFQIVKESKLGQKFYKGKMDYFYFFFHKSLDLLREGGRAGLVSTNYFGTALGARKLRLDLHERSTIWKIINFNKLKIFKGANGQHNQITFFKKGVNKKQYCHIYYALESGPCSAEILNSMLSFDEDVVIHKKVPNKKLFEGEEKYIRVNVDGNDNLSSVLEKMCTYNMCIGEYYRVNNGVHSQADYLTPKKFEFRDDKSKEVGDGIYVLDKCNKNDHKI